MACGTGAEPQQMPEVPAADGEAWDVRFEIGRPGHRIEIRAAYVREFSQAQQVRAEGGVEVAFLEGEVVSTLRAERLVLEHKRDRFGLAGGVVLRAGDSLEVQADTLVWDGEDQRLRIPGSLRVEVGQGWERGRNLSSNFAVDTWSLEAVEGHWRGRGDGADVEIRAQREESRRVKGVQEIVYDSVEVRCDGILLTGPRAIFRPGVKRFDFDAGVHGADSLAQFSAERAEIDIEGERLVVQGAVHYREEGIELKAAAVEEDRSVSRLWARGEPATFVQGARRIAAPELSYARDERILTARDTVVFREGDRELTAAELRYERDTAQLSARGAVVLQAAELAGRLTGDSLFFDLKQEVGWMRGAPSLRRSADGEEELVLKAEVLRFELRQHRLVGEGGFDLRAKGMSLSAARGVYETDSTRVLVAGGVVLDHLSDARDYRSRLEADSMVVELVDNRVERIAMPGQIFGQVDASGRRNWIEGQGGRVFMVDGNLARVEVDAAADVTHRHPEKDEVNRFHGRQMTLYFDAEGLQRALVSGAAQLVTRLQEEGGEVAVNEVSGEELEIRFADGSIAEVRIGPDIEGSYYPPEQEP
jgi:lipopolysaccharide export system protein LptA